LLDFGYELALFEQRLAFMPLSIAMDHQTGPSQTLTGHLGILRVTITDPHQPARQFGGVDIRTMNRVKIETDDITAFGRHRDGIFQMVVIE
jgi:hypothetical protein